MQRSLVACVSVIRWCCDVPNMFHYHAKSKDLMTIRCDTGACDGPNIVIVGDLIYGQGNAASCSIDELSHQQWMMRMYTHMLPHHLSWHANRSTPFRSSTSQLGRPTWCFFRRRSHGPSIYRRIHYQFSSYKQADYRCERQISENTHDTVALCLWDITKSTLRNAAFSLINMI